MSYIIIFPLDSNRPGGALLSLLRGLNSVDGAMETSTHQSKFTNFVVQYSLVTLLSAHKKDQNLDYSRA